MSPQTTMAIYTRVVLECQHCYAICRYTEAAVRRNCPACGRSIGNWKELITALLADTPPTTSTPPRQGQKRTGS